VNTKKHILVVCQHFWPESFRINDIADYFIEQDCKVDVLCGIPNYPKGKFFKGYSYFSNRKQKYNGINIHRAFEIPRGNNTNLKIFINYLSFPIASLLYVPRMLFRKYDKIFIYQLSPVMMSISGIVIGKLKRVETTMYVLDLWPENLFSVLPTNNRYLRVIATKVSHWHYKKVDKLVVLSEKMKKHLLETVGISENKIIVLPQTSEKIYETEITDEILASRFNKGFNVLFTGSITPAQSFETIIAAAKKLKAEGHIRLNWIIVGDGMSRKWLEAEVKKAGLDDSFYFEGFKPMTDIPKYTAIADVLIGCLVKSDLLEATIPAKVMSYIASGKPMVLSMDGEVQDLINNRIKCGFVGPTNNAGVFAENIKKLYRLPQKERENMGRLAREYHFKHFERSLILNKLYNFIFS
jgi:colanic acid biosynthesis glycosyl transferase WcaI